MHLLLALLLSFLFAWPDPDRKPVCVTKSLAKRAASITSLKKFIVFLDKERVFVSFLYQ